MYEHTLYYFLGNKKYPEIYILQQYQVKFQIFIGLFLFSRRSEFKNFEG